MAIYIDEKTKFGQLVLLRLKEIGKTQVWLSEQTGLTRVYISQMCSDINKHPSFKAIIKIAFALDINPEKLAYAIIQDEKERGV